MRISVRRSREARADLSDRVSVSRNTFFSRVFGDWRAARGWFLVVTFAGILLGHHSILARGVGMRPAGKGEELAASSDPTPENVLAGLEVQEKSLRELRRYLFTRLFQLQVSSGSALFHTTRVPRSLLLQATAPSPSIR